MEAKEIYKTEMQNSTNGKKEEAPQDRARKILEFKLRAVGNPDSIFILPYGTEGFKMAHMVRIANKFLSTVKRKFGISIDIKQAKEIFQEFEGLADVLWKYVYKISPNLHNIEPKDWRRVNDSIEVKKLIAHRRASMVIEPRSEESAMIAVAVKIIQQKNIELRQTSTFEELETFVKEYVKLLSSFDRLLENVSAKLGSEYKPYLKEEKV